MLDLYPKAIVDEENEAVESFNDSSDDEDVEALTVRKKRRNTGAAPEFAATFHFDEHGTSSQADREANDLKKYLKKTVVSTLEQKIEEERKRNNTSEEIKIDVKLDDDDEIEQLGTDANDSLKEKNKKIKGKTKDATAFFEELPQNEVDLSFDEMNLSRPILKAIGASGYTDPTPIQAACIPVALAGKDICACAATGTGKTAAFVLPILERLLYRPGQRSVTRVLVLVPTRELAIQVFQVFRKVSVSIPRAPDICLCAGGLDLKAQEAALRQGPDIVVATPGRLLDHLHNAPSFTLSTVEVLVLDEADRMLEQAFEEQMKEVIRLCATNRQTLLFSATMTDQIEHLADMSLKKPVKIFINENTETALKLRQEFIRIRSAHENDRESIVAALITRTFQEQTIVFARTKRDCMRLQILLGLLGVKVGQMHSSLTQSQRVDALAKFKRRELDVLVSTDLAARGLDIEGIQTVINMHMPSNIKQYIHRVGRTARAGKGGRSISLVGEDERKLFKEIVATNVDKALKQRVVAPEVIAAYHERIDSLEESIKRIEEEEKAERSMRIAEEEMKRTEDRLLKGKSERDGRKWIKGPTEADKIRKLEEKRRLKQLEKKHKKTQKTSEEIAAERTMAFQAREAKRQRKGRKMNAVVESTPKRSKALAGRVTKAKAKKSSFTSALAGISKKGVKAARAGPEDAGFRNAKRSHMKSGKQKRS